MGRTQRKRKRIKSRSFHKCDGETKLIQLNSWLSKEGVRRNHKLILAVFDDTGRGVLTNKKISAGEELITLPINSTINVITILSDIPFRSIFSRNNECLLKFKASVSFQSLLAFYLSYLKLRGARTKWFIYLNSLPEEYTVPYFLHKDIQNNLDADIFSIISKQKVIIQNSYYIFENILRTCVCDDNFIQLLRRNFNLKLYEWAYFTVNTRCVYMDLTNVLDLKNIQCTLLSLVNDNTKISLCPYLDMINHSPNSRNETKLMIPKDFPSVDIINLHQEFFSDVWFSIYTKNNFDPFTQVFICYGDSHNLKLITEYGFFLPNNELDCVLFSYENIINFLSLNSFKLSQDQSSFVDSHGLNKDLYIDFRGLSFNLYGLLMVVKYYYDDTIDVSRLIYSAAVGSYNKDLNDMIKPMIKNKLDEIKKSIKTLINYQNKCVIIDNCVGLMSQYVNILEKFIKC
ncbi:unnamed protein product [Diatraea saccharalis]|uniref:SET domain-containing protein n=1 Tax=Diatraea saccharalis TaxID=40085 RepID=A0A9N9QWN0_9NEOP|nr:unnamed protein product [Diatraea saccharalis]